MNIMRYLSELNVCCSSTSYHYYITIQVTQACKEGTYLTMQQRSHTNILEYDTIQQHRSYFITGYTRVNSSVTMGQYMVAMVQYMVAMGQYMVYGIVYGCYGALQHLYIDMKPLVILQLYFHGNELTWNIITTCTVLYKIIS